MSWNGSDSGSNKKVEASVPLARKPAPSFKKGIIAGLVVVLGAGLAAWWIGRPGTSAPAKEKKTATKQIAEVKPQIVTQAVEVAEKKVETPKEKVHDPNARPTKVGEVVNGYVMLPSGRIHKRKGVVMNSIESRPKPAYAIFENDTDNQIACLLSIKTGSYLFGTPRYNGKFKQAFVESLKTPIVITAEDTPEQVQLKNDVIEARAQLKAAMNRGEDIEQIMLDSRKDIQDMMRYRLEIQKQFHDYRSTGEYSDADVEDMLKACNTMLEEKGVAPLRYGPISKISLQNMAREVQEDNE